MNISTLIHVSAVEPQTHTWCCECREASIHSLLAPTLDNRVRVLGQVLIRAMAQPRKRKKYSKPIAGEKIPSKPIVGKKTPPKLIVGKQYYPTQNVGKTNYETYCWEKESKTAENPRFPNHMVTKVLSILVLEFMGLWPQWIFKVFAGHPRAFDLRRLRRSCATYTSGKNQQTTSKMIPKVNKTRLKTKVNIHLFSQVPPLRLSSSSSLWLSVGEACAVPPTWATHEG